ncbi:MAG: ABC transporter ATP-binding protein [Candidatus Bipolaricaulota bacterium]
MSDGFHDDEIVGKAFDARLTRRMLQFLTPYRRIFAICVALTIALAGIELALPVLTKTAIDAHMTLPYALVTLESAPSGDPLDLGGGRYLVRRSAVPSDTWRAWEEADAVEPERVLFLSVEDSRSEVVERYPTAFVAVPGGFAASESALRTLPPREVEVLRGTALANLLRLAILYAFALLVRFVFAVAQAIMLEYTGQRVIYDMRRKIFAHVLRLPVPFFDRMPVGRLVTRATNDVGAIHEFFTSMLVSLFRDTILVAGIVVVMLQLDWRLALVVFALFPLIGLAAWQFRNRVRAAFREVRRQIARLNAYVQESISGIRIIQAFVQEVTANRRFVEINQAKYDADFRQIVTFAIFRPLMSFLSSFAVALVLWYGGLRTLGGALSLGALVAFLQYVRMLFEPILNLSEGYNVLQAAMASAERIFLLLDEKQESRGGGAQPEKVRGKIEFQHVWFAYSGEDWVLKDVSFAIEPGERIAIVGPTGSGKTTLIRLLLRMYPIQRGEILVDGLSIDAYDLAYLRAQMAVVLQDVFLFSGTVMDNIRLRSAIPEEKAVEAARFVSADFVEAFPDGYATEVKERGATLSVGERQLLSYARAVAFEPKILVLDEATASIDSHTEDIIQASLRRILEGRTSIAIAHRLSTIRESNRILVLHHGEIVEEGDHETLLRVGGLYAALYSLQFGGAGGST